MQCLIYYNDYILNLEQCVRVRLYVCVYMYISDETKGEYVKRCVDVYNK